MAAVPPIAPPAFPLADWQFWAVTLVAVLAGAWIVRKLIPTRSKRKRAGAKRATLTIGGRAVDRHGDDGDCH